MRVQFWFLPCLYIGVLANNEPPTAQTSYGVVAGIVQEVNGKKVNAFLGIPYAKSPVGELRFKPPQELPPLKEIINAKSFAKSCVQFINEKFKSSANSWWIPQTHETSEDCLYLNIWTPSPKPENAAVMVWIHGGGYEAGSPAIDMFNGKYLVAQEDVVYVSINYRLSVLGFLILDSDECPGNMALMDQGMALKYVQQNIASFGGDPHRVTIFGESAGGGSVGHHLNIPSHHGLFRRAILQSGSSSSVWSFLSQADAVKNSEYFVHVLGCASNINNRLDILACLRQKTIEELIEAYHKVPRLGLLVFVPTVDGNYIQHEPKKVLKDRVGFKKSVDILLGETKEDGIFFPIMQGLIGPLEDSYIEAEKLYGFIQGVCGFKESSLQNTVRFLYTNWENPEGRDELRQQLIHFTTDYLITCSMSELADSSVAHGHRVFRYRFSHRPSNSSAAAWAGSLHASELSFVMGFATDQIKGLTEKEVELSMRVMQLWTNFAKTGDPNPPNDRKVWPAYTEEKKEFLDIGLQMKTEANLRVQHCAFWNQVVPKILKAADEPEKI